MECFTLNFSLQNFLKIILCFSKQTLFFQSRTLASHQAIFIMKSIQVSYLFLMLVFLLASCDSRESRLEESTGTAASNGTVEALFQKVNKGLTEKPNWKTHWESVLGKFEVVDFEWVFTDSIDPMEMPEKNPVLQNNPLFPFQIAHPEGDGTIDIYSYKLETQPDLDQSYFNPDSEVIWYRADGMRERLLFVGPTGMFEEGFWISPSDFIVLGYFIEDEGYRPMIWLIQTDTHQLSQFRLKKWATGYDSDSYLSQKLTSLELASNGN